jgi:O-antigen/teichoic acid export membrane protein
MIARKTFLFGITQIINAIVGWIALCIIAKLWGNFAPAALGVIQFTISFLAIFNLVADLGFGQAHIKKVSEGKELARCIGTYAFIKLLLTLLMMGVALSYIFVAEWLGVDFPSGTTKSLLLIFLLYYLFQNLFSIPFRTFDGLRETAKRSVASVVEVFVRVPLMIGVALLAMESITKTTFSLPAFLLPFQSFLARDPISALGWCYVFGMAGTFLASLIFFKKYPIGKPSLRLLKEYSKFALVVALIPIITILLTSVDKVMIGFFWSEVEVGYYFSAYKIITLLLIIPLAIETLLFPTISSYHAKKDFKGIASLTRITERYASMIAMPLVILLLVIPGPILSILFSKNFLPAVGALGFLACWSLIYSLDIPYSSLLRGINRPDLLVKVGITACGFNILANLLLIPKNGLLAWAGIVGPEAAGFATLMAELVALILLRFEVKKVVPMKIFQTHTPRHLLAGLLMGICLIALSTFNPLDKWWELFIYLALALASYFAFNYLLREFNKKDLNFFVNLLHPNELIKYVLAELRK